MPPTSVSDPDVTAITVFLVATRVVRDLGTIPPGLESVGNDGSGSQYPANLST